MHKLYFFRNQITARVLVSPTFRMDSSILNQIGEHRPEVKIRGDHWVPFAVLTGIQSPEALAAIQKRVVKTVYDQPLGQYRLPLPQVKRNPFEPRPPRAEDPFALKPQKKGPTPRRDPLRTWEVPKEVSEKMRDLCRALIVSREVAEEVEQSAAKGEQQYTLWFERDQYRHMVEENDDGLVWPDFVEYKKLALLRNRYPLVPGFDRKALRDMKPQQFAAAQKAQAEAERQTEAQTAGTST
ncbi:hypothetical protein DFJ77DRAFT_440907 [Powellomyces hirtus]|nr:hypothetical protein DFJ77DRAFT_440907 [Powellomyces hirtus]